MGQNSYHDIEQIIAQRTADNNRGEGSVTLVVVSKTFGAQEITPVLERGARVFGENRVQEAKAKWPLLKDKYEGVELHLIGPLQSNKAGEAVGLFDVIHTIDREKIAAAIAKEMKTQKRTLKLFVQVNTGLEEQKAGIDPRQAVEFVNLCRKKYDLKIDGLMCIPPNGENPGPHFALLQKLALECNCKNLSMGMSGDFEIAIDFGATHVRVGSAIFGGRDYSPQG